MAKELPKVGDRIPSEKFHESKCNMRYREPFGDDEEDKILIANLRARRGKTAELFMARPEGDGYGVYQGRRKFLGLKAIGTKEFVVGEHCFIKDLTDEEATDASWIENLEFLRKVVEPITRAKKLAERIAFSTLTLRQLAARDGVGASTYCEWLKVLDLSPRMQQALSKGLLTFKDALMVARLKLGKDLQDELAELLETQGINAFKARLNTVIAVRGRGLRAGIYEIERLTFDRRSKKDTYYYEVLTKAAKARGFEKVADFIKAWIIDHIEEIAKEIAT